MTDQIPTSTSQSGLTDNVAGGLAYLTFIPAIIFLIMEPYNRNPIVKFHCWQSILLTGAYVAWAILRVVLGIVLHGFFFLFLLVGMVVGFIFFIVWLIAIVQAFNGKRFSIPIIAAIAEKQANS